MVASTSQIYSLHSARNMVLFMRGRLPIHLSQMAERKNHTLTDLVNAMLDTAGLSKEWWGEAILTACHVLNRILQRIKK